MYMIEINENILALTHLGFTLKFIFTYHSFEMKLQEIRQ